jgi:hypothetical protein
MGWTPACDFAYHFSLRISGIDCCGEKFTLSRIANVAKAVKTASVIHPNQSHNAWDALRRTASACTSWLATVGHDGNPANDASFFRLP